MKIISFILTVVAIVSCSKTRDKATYYISPEDFNRTVTIQSPVIYNIRYLPLETNENARIDYISKILYKNGRFYIFDRSYNKTITVFSKDGKFLYRIDKNGFGAGEYSNPVSIDVTNNGDVYLWDNAKNKFIRYFNEGRSFDEFKLTNGIKFNDFVLLDNQRLILNQVISNNSVIFNTAIYHRNDKKILENIPAREIYNDVGSIQYSDNKLNRSAGGILFYKRFSGEIYKWRNEELKLYVKLNTDLLPPAEFVRQNLRDPHRSALDDQYIKDITNIYENKNFITFNLHQTNKPVTYVIDKHSDRTICFTSFNNRNLFLNNNINGTIGEDFFSVLSPAGIFSNNRGEEFRMKVRESTLDETTKMRLLSLNQNSNIVIVVFSIKNI